MFREERKAAIQLEVMAMKNFYIVLLFAGQGKGTNGQWSRARRISGKPSMDRMKLSDMGDLDVLPFAI